METIECDKSTVTCDFRTAQCEYYTIKCEKKISEPPNVRKVHSHVMLVLYNVRMVPSNMGKNKGIAKYDKSTVTCDVGIAHCKDGTLNVRKKIRELLNVTKVQSYVILVLHYVRMIPSNVKKKKNNKGTTKCDKSTLTCDVSIVQYEDGSIKCDVLVI